MKILFLTRSLNRGGAERQIVTLATQLLAEGHGITVAVFYAGGALEAELHSAGVRVVPLNKRHRWDVAGFLWRFAAFLRAERADVIHSCLTGPNLLALLARIVAPKTAIVWGVRASALPEANYGRFERATFVAERRFSRHAGLVICNSFAGRQHAVANGFPADRTIVIHNGFNVDRFVPDKEAGNSVRQEWGIAADDPIVGMVARIDPLKDHPGFLRAAAQIHRTLPGAYFVCIGDGADEARNRLVQLGSELGISHRLRLLPGRTDIAHVYPAFTVLVLSSYTEGLPNVVGEAMACGVPCVVTDVGDAAIVVGDTGRVVPPSNPDALAQACLALLGESPEEHARRSAAARARIVEEFSIARLVQRTEHAFEQATSAQR